MDTVSPVLSVSEIFLNRPLEELEADRYRKEVEESRRLVKVREEKRERLEKERLKKKEERIRAELPSYMGMKVDLLA